MKFAFYSRFETMLPSLGIQKTAEYVRARGLNAVEFYCDAVADVSAIKSVEEAKEVKRVLDAYGLPLVCVSCAYDAVACPDAVKTMQKTIEITSALGSPFLHHTLLIHPAKGKTEDEIYREIDLAADAAVKIADAAKEYGITCLYEDQGGYVNGHEKFGRFFEKVKSRAGNAGVCFDVGNILYADEEPEEFLPYFAKDIRHVHVKDYLRKSVPVSPGKYWKPTKGGDFLRGTMIGHGVIDHPRVMALLREIGYDGYFALELDHPEPFEDGIAQALSYLPPLFEGETK